MMMFLLGILVWSLISTILYIVYERCDIDFIPVIMGGPVLWVVVLLCFGINKIIWFVSYKKFKAKQKKSS